LLEKEISDLENYVFEKNYLIKEVIATIRIRRKKKEKKRLWIVLV